MENQRNTLLTCAYYCQGKSMDELRQSLLLATLELETTRLKAQEELKMRDDQLNHLKALCTEAIRERDEARDKCQRLVFERLLFQQQQFHLQQQQQQLHLQQQQQQQQCQQNAPLSGISSIEDEPRRGLDSNNGFSSPTSFISPRFLSPIGTPMKRVLINMKGYLEEVGHLTKLNPQDAWLPITESRNGNAHYAAFHNLNAGVVFQALVLPVAFSFLGWSWGILSLTIAYFWQLYTLWILVQLHEAVPGKRYNRYVELAQAAFGERLGVWLASLQFICQQEQLDFNRSANDLLVGMAQESELRPRLNSRSDYTHTLHPPSHFPSL